MTPTDGLAALAALAWAYLLCLRGFFWLARERDAPAVTFSPQAWPSVAAIVPARNEADVIARSGASLLAQDYPGPLSVIVVDDGSTDGTAALGRALADPEERLQVVAGAPPPGGWTGKLWALRQGVAYAEEAGAAPDFFLFTDADIAHAPDTLTSLVARAEAGGLVLTSLMARLTVATWAERLLIPAFVFFFAMLNPFAWVNDPGRRTAAAAGGCMLARREALEAAGGIEAIAGEIIDDCALAARMKTVGPIWLGLTDRARSLRPYGGVAEIGAMVARSAYAQLRFAPLLLAATVAGMSVIFIAPPLLAIAGHGAARLGGAAGWLAMAGAYQPMLRFYRLGFWRGALMPVIAGLYVAFTVGSAIAVWRGRGGMWKGRSQVVAALP